jgi:hypothetical protein
MKLLFALVVLVLAAACQNPEGSALSSTPSAPTGPAPVVVGTVVDARTGKPVPGALVVGPGGVETKSDSDGRFVLRGLAHGAEGDLVGTAKGLSGRNRLRALEGGVLEVVLYLR